MKRSMIHTLVVAFFIQSATAGELHTSGFASLNMTKISNDDYSIHEFEDGLDFSTESLVGIQLKSALSDEVDFTVQMVSKGRFDWQPTVDWAYITYNISDQTNLKAGRLKVPYYKYTDYANVGFAYDWVRPPQSIYTSLFEVSEGFMLSHTEELLGFTTTFTGVMATFDNNSLEVSKNKFVDAHVDYLRGGMIEGQNGPFSFRMTFLLSKLTVQDPELFGLLSLIDQFKLNALHNAIEIRDDKGTFRSASLGYDNGKTYATSEFVSQRSKDTVVQNNNAWYLTIGQRFSQFTLYAMAERNRFLKRDDLFTHIQSNHPLFPVIAGIVESQDFSLKSYSIGGRYDVGTGLALKAQVMTVENDKSNESNVATSLGLSLVF